MISIILYFNNPKASYKLAWGLFLLTFLLSKGTMMIMKDRSYNSIHSSLDIPNPAMNWLWGLQIVLPFKCLLTYRHNDNYDDLGRQKLQ